MSPRIRLSWSQMVCGLDFSHLLRTGSLICDSVNIPWMVDSLTPRMWNFFRSSYWTTMTTSPLSGEGDIICRVPCRLACGKMQIGGDFRQQDEPPWTCFEGLVDEPDRFCAFSFLFGQGSCFGSFLFVFIVFRCSQRLRWLVFGGWVVSVAWSPAVVWCVFPCAPGTLSACG